MLLLKIIIKLMLYSSHPAQLNQQHMLADSLQMCWSAGTAPYTWQSLQRKRNNGSSVCVSCYAPQKHSTLKYKEYTARSHGTIASMHVTVEPPTRYSVAGHFAGRVPA